MQNIPFTSVPVNADNLPASPTTSNPVVKPNTTTGSPPPDYRNYTHEVTLVDAFQVHNKPVQTITTGGANLPIYIVVHPNAPYAIGPFTCPTRAMNAARSQGIDWRYVPVLPPGIST